MNKMTFYQKEINRIKGICHSNDGQIQTVIGMRNYMESNFDKELNLDLFSHIRFTSKFHLLRLFKKYYGQTPRQYLIDKRITKSKSYLRMGMSVSETCYSIGFESPSSFSTLFKKKTGKTPTDFQKEQFSQSQSKVDS